MTASSFNANDVQKVSQFLQEYMSKSNIKCMTADECADILAKEDIVPNNVGPKLGFNFRQMLRDGRDGKIEFVAGARQQKPNSKWYIDKIL